MRWMVIAASLLLACEQKPTADTTPSATPPPPKPVATATKPCPPGSSASSVREPCRAKGSARAIEATYSGQTGPKGPHFTLHNRSGFTITTAAWRLYAYDATGKQLDFKPPGHPEKASKFLEGGFDPVVWREWRLAPDQSIEVDLFRYEPHMPGYLPAGAKFELEVPKVSFEADGGTTDWINSDLAPDVRPAGGVH